MKNSSLYLLLFFTLKLYSDQFSFLLYNDFFAGTQTDQHFTNGVSISWLDDTYNSKSENEKSSYSDLIHTIIQNIPFVVPDEKKYHNAGISLSQYILTPSDIKSEELQYGDFPYAGYLNVSFYMFEWNRENFREFRLELGVVGAESGAEFFQNNFHRLIGATLSRGWKHQIGRRYIINPLFRYGEKSVTEKYANGMEMDWMNQIGFEAGNFEVVAFAESVVRVGENYMNNFNVSYPYLKEEASLLSLDADKHHDFGWSVDLGVKSEIVAYSYVLDSYQSSKNFFNYALHSSFDIYYDRHKFAFFYQVQSPYIKRQKSFDLFGGLKYIYQF